MEWVVAILGVGCVFYAFQITMDYVRYRKMIKPKIQRLEVAKEELKAKIEGLKAGLDESQGQLEPIRQEVGKLEQEYLDLQQQIQQEREKQKSRTIRFRS